MFDGWPAIDEWLQWRRVVDVGLVAAILYQLLVVVRGSRSGSLLLALPLLFGLWYLSRDDVLDLPTLYWVLDRFMASAVVLLVVLFQEDIRRALGALLRAPLLGGRARLSSELVEEIVRACAELCERNLGGLIVVEQQAPLDRYLEEGVRIGGEVSWQVLVALFNSAHASPTHDGAVVVQKGRLSAAGCFLPLAGGAGIPGTLGSRHRAALGLADETDAVVIVVSEETSTCSLAYMGQLDLHLSPADLRERLRALGGDAGLHDAWQQPGWRRRIQFHPRADAVDRPPAAQAAPAEPPEVDVPRPPAPDLDVSGDEGAAEAEEGRGRPTFAADDGDGEAEPAGEGDDA